MATRNDMMDGPVGGSGQLGGGQSGMGSHDDLLGQKASQAAGGIADAVDGLGQQGQGIRDQAMKLRDDALSQARSAAEEGKSRAAETISGVAQAAREAAGRFGENETTAPIGRYGNQAAEALERFASTLRNKEVDALLNDVVGLVRRNPAIAVGVAVAAGFAVSRLLRADGASGSGTYGERRTMGQGYGATGGFEA